MYLHASIVRTMYIVRRSGYPLIQDSLRSDDPTFRAYKSKHMRKLNMSEYRHLQMKKAEKPVYLPDPAEGTRS